MRRNDAAYTPAGAFPDRQQLENIRPYGYFGDWSVLAVAAAHTSGAARPGRRINRELTPKDDRGKARSRRPCMVSSRLNPRLGQCSGMTPESWNKQLTDRTLAYASVDAGTATRRQIDVSRSRSWLKRLVNHARAQVPGVLAGVAGVLVRVRRVAILDFDA